MTTQILEQRNGKNTRVKVVHKFSYRGIDYSVVILKKSNELEIVTSDRLFSPEIRKNDFWTDSFGKEYQVLEFTERYVIFVQKGDTAGDYPSTVKRTEFIARYKPAF